MNWFAGIDCGRTQIVCYIKNFYEKEGSIIYIDSLVFTKENYLELKNPGKYYCEIINIDEYRKIPIGICAVVISKPEFNWLNVSYSYDTIGVGCILIPMKDVSYNVVLNK